jgi:hypothetical protein
MISSIDKRDANRRAGETSDGFETAKSGADNDHVRTARNRACGSLKPGGLSQPSFPASAKRSVGQASAPRLRNCEDLNLATLQVDEIAGALANQAACERRDIEIVPRRGSASSSPTMR